MSKAIYDMINDVETDFTKYRDNSSLDQVTVKRLKKNFSQGQKKKHSYKGVVAAACCLVITGLALGPFKTQVEAAGRLLAYNISSALGIKKDLSSYENIVNETITHDGISVTLNSVILDRDGLIVSTTEQFGESNYNFDEFSLIGDVYINGRRCSTGAGGGSARIGNGTNGTVMEYDLENIDTSGEFDIELELHDVMGTVKQSWDFSFHASGSELRAATTEQSLNIPLTLPDNSELSLEALSVNPVGYKIYYSKTTSTKSYDLKLVGTDDLGNPVAFYLSRSSRTGGRLNLDTTTGLIGEGAASLTLTPYAVEFPEESGQLSDDWVQIGEAFTITLPR